MPRNSGARSIPKAYLVQLARLFGSESKEARKLTRSPAQWRRTLRRVLVELDRYVTANLETDTLHRMILATGLCAADHALQEDEFWPGYAEGITRFALALLGDYPDHRRRKGGKKAANHYRLDRCRTLCYFQNTDQKLATLLAAGSFSLPGLTKPPGEALTEFRQQKGLRPGYREFFEWYRGRYPQDYTAIF